MTTHDWQTLTDLTRGRAVVVERVRTVADSVAIEGRFEPPPLALLTHEDQVFVAAFIQAHGSIKQMEQWFGISYPTVKNRLNKIAGALPQIAAAIEPTPTPAAAASESSAVLDKLERGELDVAAAVAALRAKRP